MTEPEMAAIYPGRGFAGTPRVPTDAERLDWLGRTRAKLEPVGRAAGHPEFYWSVSFDRHLGRLYRFATSPRAAIDAGMQITEDR